MPGRQWYVDEVNCHVLHVFGHIRQTQVVNVCYNSLLSWSAVYVGSWFGRSHPCAGTYLTNSLLHIAFQ